MFAEQFGSEPARWCRRLPNLLLVSPKRSEGGYRRLPVGEASLSARHARGLAARDTADWQSAARNEAVLPATHGAEPARLASGQAHPNAE